MIAAATSIQARVWVVERQRHLRPVKITARTGRRQLLVEVVSGDLQ